MLDFLPTILNTNLINIVFKFVEVLERNEKPIDRIKRTTGPKFKIMSLKVQRQKDYGTDK